MTVLENPRRWRRFLKVTALFSFLGAITTTLLIFLPNPETTGFDSVALLHQNPLYLAKKWILFLHPQFNLFASFGIAFLLFKKYPICAILGSTFLIFWAYTEMSQQAMLIDTLNQMWRPQYLNAGNSVEKQMYETLIYTANGLSDGQYFVVIYSFGIGSLCFGCALLKEEKLARYIGIVLIFIGILSLASFTRYYLGASLLNAAVDWLYHYVYSYVQPLVRLAIGAWIIIKAHKITDPKTHS